MIKIHYIHYWYIKNERDIDDITWSKISKDSQKIFEYFKENKDLCLELGDWNGYSEPIVDNDKIIFNGGDDKRCDSFVIFAKCKDRYHNVSSISNYYFDFCNTARKPYDIVVQMILLIFKHHMQDDIFIHSDSSNTDWINAIELTKKLFNYPDIMVEYVLCKNKNRGYKYHV